MAIYDPTDDDRLDKPNTASIMDQVLEQVKQDVENGDVTAIEEMLRFVPIDRLKAYLPEEA
jgi:hypothetical protein